MSETEYKTPKQRYDEEMARIAAARQAVEDEEEPDQEDMDLANEALDEDNPFQEDEDDQARLKTQLAAFHAGKVTDPVLSHLLNRKIRADEAVIKAKAIQEDLDAEILDHLRKIGV